MMPIQPTPRTRGVRYVDVRLAIPDDSPYPSDDSFVGVLRVLPGTRSPAANQSISPFTFVPIDAADEHGDDKNNSPSPAPSPFAYRKSTPSPAMTATTAGSYESYASLVSRGTSAVSSSRPPMASANIRSTAQAISPLGVPSFQDSNIYRPVAHRMESPMARRSPPPKGKQFPLVRDDDIVRKKKVKTELCQSLSTGKPCPFVNTPTGCCFAHSEEELQMTKLMDLAREGLVDIETFRVKPCLDFIATGSCPFGKRCTSLHDPRVAGGTNSWLPHTETQGNTIATDINVESLHQKCVGELLYANPFGNAFSLEMNGWEDLYRLICNTTGKEKRRRCTISAMHKIDIALQMQGDADWHYKFRPQHIIHDELCMVLQEKAFSLIKSGEATELPLGAYNPRSPTQVLVREIAFGPDSDPTVRNVALWFNISDDSVTLCTPQHAKRYRWKRGLKKTKTGGDGKSPSSPFDFLECFFMIRPHDPFAFGLTTRILQHRLGVLKAEHLSKNLQVRHKALKKLEMERLGLKKSIEGLILHWNMWAWPITDGRAQVDDTTPVPPADNHYSFGRNDNSNSGKTPTQRVWESFISNLVIGQHKEGAKETASKKHLSIFERLAMGEEMCNNRSLPHIISSEKAKSRDLSADSERCWRSLLLKRNDPCEPDEWEIVREHFENSRSKKVLSILQQ